VGVRAGDQGDAAEGPGTVKGVALAMLLASIAFAQATFSNRTQGRIPSRPKAQAQDCPSPETVQPPATATEEDSVTLIRTACFGSCPDYRVRVSGDGTVVWQGNSSVQEQGQRTIAISRERALALLNRFLTAEVWALCGKYTVPITDNPTTSVVIQTRSGSKRIEDYARSSPPWFQELQDEIDRTTNSHQFRHGDPKTEPLSHLQAEYLPKPGMTDLMRTAHSGTIDALREAMQAGADVHAADASGWTPLFYAAASWQGMEKMRLLLAAGADPRQVTPSGDTLPMAMALSRSFDAAIAKSAGNLNAQNQNGETVLMMLVRGFCVDCVREALAAGADPTLRDRQKRTALERMVEAVCNRPGQKVPCAEPDEPEYQQIKRLLTEAASTSQP
jgi:hypothetical protein